MRRIALTSLLACVVAIAPATLAEGARTPTRNDARVRLTACRPALDLVRRSLTVDATMRSLQNGDRMQMRFDLFQRLPRRTRFKKLPGPGLGTWNPATPGVDRFRFRKPIQNLPAPAAYYVRVSFRWLDGHGTAFARTARSSRTCFQPDLRPDLRIIGLITSRPLGGGQRAYRVLIRNAGLTAARDFDAVLSVAGLPRPAVRVGGLAAGEGRVIELTGPRCEPGQTARVELDPDNRVDESNETNDSRSTTC